MNERIKLLAEQAGYRDIFDNDTKARARLEKYTELLINDCIEAIQNESMALNVDEFEHGLRIAEGAIRTHFGVEE